MDFCNRIVMFLNQFMFVIATSNLATVKRLSDYQIYLRSAFENEKQAMILIVGFEDSPCKRDNSDVHRRDTGPSTACCRLAVNPFEKKTTVSRLPTISALSTTTLWLNASDQSTAHLFTGDSSTVHQISSEVASSEVAGSRLHPAIVDRMSLFDVTDNFPLFYPCNFISNLINLSIDRDEMTCV